MLEKIAEIIEEQLNITTTITEQTTFKDDLGADSLDIFELITALEETYDIEIPAEDLEGITTVGDIIEYLSEQGVE